MLNNFFFKIPISYKKIYKYSKILSNKPISYFYKLNNFNKFNIYLKNISNFLITYFKKDVFIKNFLICKNLYIKKINYRAKGKIDFIKKRKSLINIRIYG